MEAKIPDINVHLLNFDDRPAMALTLEQAGLPKQSGQFDRYLSSIGYGIVSQDGSDGEGGWKAREQQDDKMPEVCVGVGAVVIVAAILIYAAKGKEGKPMRGREARSNSKAAGNTDDRFGTHDDSERPDYGRGSSANVGMNNLTLNREVSSGRFNNDGQRNSGNRGNHRTGYTYTGPGPGDEARNSGNSQGSWNGQGESAKGDKWNGDMGLTTAALTLGVDKDASTQEVRDAFRQQAFRNHPDRGGDQTGMKKVNIANDVFGERKGK